MTDRMRQRYRDLVLAILDECHSIDQSTAFVPVADDPSLIAAISKLVEGNEQGEMLFRGEGRHFRAVSSRLFRSMGLPVGDDSPPFETLAAHERQTIDHHLGLIKKWVGDPKGAKRFYEHEGSPSLPGAMLQRSAFGCFEEGATLPEFCLLYAALGGKAVHYWNVALSESSDPCSIERGVWLWQASQRFGHLAKEVRPDRIANYMAHPVGWCATR